MNLDFALFANHATYQSNGLFSALNAGLDWISCKSLPSVCLDLALLARFSLEPTECGKEYECQVVVTAPSGTALAPNLTLNFTPKPQARHPERPTIFLAYFRYGGFYFQEAGFHRFSFVIDDLTIGEIFLEAVVEPTQ
jgi:hypothetical protein